MQELFLGQVPRVWTDAVADAYMAQPKGYSMGGNVLTNKLASPETVPGVALVGDAGHATSWRLGFSLETSLGTAAALGRSLRTSNKLSEALHRLNDEQQGKASALAQIDRLVRLFLLTLHLHSLAKHQSTFVFDCFRSFAGTVAGLGRPLCITNKLAKALHCLNDEQQGKASALARLDRLVPSSLLTLCWWI
jgi:hypothetical protein